MGYDELYLPENRVATLAGMLRAMRETDDAITRDFMMYEFIGAVAYEIKCCERKTIRPAKEE